jgi:hypothetical protein
MDEPESPGQRNDDRAYHRDTSGGHRPLTPQGAQGDAQRNDQRQLAQLDADVEPEQRPAQRRLRQPELAQDGREPEAVDEPEDAGQDGPEVAAAGRILAAGQQVVHADQHHAERDRRLDERRRRGDDAEGGERQRHAVADGEGCDDQAEAAERSAEEQQADHEEDVVRADRDVVDACGHERRQHRRGPGPAARVVVHRRTPRVEDGLMAQRAVLVDVDERLVQGVVGKQRRVDCHPRRASRDRRGEREPQRLPLGERRQVRQRHGDGAAIDHEPQPAGEQFGQRGAVPAGRRRIEQCPGVREPELVCGVEVVDRERTGDALARDAQVEEAEGRRMRGGNRGPADERGHQHEQATTGERRRHRVRRLRGPGQPGSRWSAMSSRGRRSAAASRRPGSRECRRSNQGGRRASGAADA